MNDNQFDDFVNDRLKDLAAPVPAGLWEKVAEGQFDQFIGGKLRDHAAPVPEGLWEKIADHNFDHFVADKVDGQEAPVPAGMWDRIADGQFDSFVADKLLDHEAPVPAGLWEKVKPEEDEDDRVVFWWFRYPAAAVLLVALLTAGAWGGYRYFFQKKNDGNTAQTVAPAQQNHGSENNTADNNSGNTAIPLAEGNAKNNGAAIPENGSTASQTLQEKNAGQLSTPSVNGNRTVDRATGIDRSAGATIASNVNNNRSLLLPPVKSNGIDITTGNYNAATHTANQAVTGELQSLEPLNAVPELYIPTYSAQATIPISLDKYTLADLTNKHLSAGSRKFKSVIICPSDKGHTDWYIEPYLAGNFGIKSVSNVSATPLYMLKKDSSERSGIGFSAGVRVVKPITDNFLVKAGLQFTQANEKYVYRTENEVKTTTVVTVRTIIRAPGDTVIVNDTSVLQTAGFKTNSVGNRYRSIDVPVTVGYEFGDDDLRFGINAGVVFNLTTWYQGMVLDASLANVPLNKSGNGIYKTNLGLGLTGSVSIVKKLSEGMHAFAEPYFRYNLSDMSTQQSGFKQRLSLGGLAVGLRFNLNRY